MVCLFSMCSRGFEGHQNDKFFIYKACEKGDETSDSGNMGSRNQSLVETTSSTKLSRRRTA